MADENDTPAAENKPVPRRRAPRAASKNDTASQPAATKRASRPATTAPKKAATTKSAPKRSADSSAEPQSRADRARGTVEKATEAVGGKRTLIAGGLVAAAAGAAAAALLSLRSSTPKGKGGWGGKAHQPDGTDSSKQMEAMIADESMIPESTPGGSQA